MDIISSSVQQFCALYLVQCSLGLVAPESVGTCGSQIALNTLLALVLLPRRTVLERPPPPRPPTARPTKTSRPDLFGMERYEARLLDFLEQDDGTAPSTLGITGARGVGKSTLLRLAYAYYWEQRFFRYVFHADAGQDGFTADARRGILARGVGYWPDGADHVASFLRNQSFVLLLDDVRADGVFDLAAAGLPATLGPRQKVVFATRDESVCAAMGCGDGNVLRMGCLGEDDAWNLFKYNVGGHIIDSNPIIKELAKEIVPRCRGYPGALLAVGGALSTKKQWGSWIVANELLISNNMSPTGAIQDDDDDQGYPCLQYFKERNLGV